MKKITQNLTNVKAWQSIVFAFMFLFSLTINAQEVGQEYLVNPSINTATGANSSTPDTGWDGPSGNANFNFQGNGNYGGWTGGTGGAYASASDVNGDCHSADRMFKFNKVGGADGQYIFQTINSLPAGNYNWSLYTKWGDAGHVSGPTGTAAGNLPTWSAEGDNEPKFTILVQDADGNWVADQANVTTEPTTALTWVQDAGTWTNTETRDVRVKMAKNGGTAAAGGSNTDKLMYIDDVSLAYASPLEGTYTKVFTGLDIYDNGVLYDLTTTISKDDFRVANGQNFDYSEANEPTYDENGDIVLEMKGSFDDQDIVMWKVDYDFNPALPSDTGIVYTNIESNVGGQDPVGQSSGGSGFTSNETRTYLQSHLGAPAYPGSLQITAADEVRKITFQILNQADPNNGAIVLEDSMLLDFNVLWLDPVEPSTGCDLTINMADSWGDGWNGNTLDIYVNGELFSAGNTIENGFSAIATISTNYGDTVLFDFVSGGSFSYPNETSFTVVDSNGNTVASGGGSDSVDATFECLDPDAVNLSASVATDGALATFSFDITNFVIDPQDTPLADGHGHIHWSIFESSDLETAIQSGMLYSAEDIAVPLPNGNHTMVFSLVDNGHTALDPPVESIVTFSTFDGTVACDSSYTYIYGDNESGILFTSTNTNGGAVTVTMTGQTETCCDEVVITDGAGNELYNVGGDHTGVSVTSEDGTINVSIVSDGSYSPGSDGFGNGTEMTFDITCAEPPVPLMLQGILDLDTGGNTGKGIHVVANLDIADLSIYGIGVANNGEGTDGQEYTFPAVSVSAGTNIMIARDPATYATYFEMDVATFTQANNDISQNGDDAIELFENGEVIETFGDTEVDGSGEAWEYMDSWAYKVDGAWTYGGVNCADDAETNATSNCVYPFGGVYTAVVNPVYNVTFTVNTANIEVGPNGMFLGGGIIGGANEHPMSDDDSDGTWEVTIPMEVGSTGNYIFLNSPNDGGDWGAKENLAGQECADGQYDDRLLAPITGDTTLQHCFGSCETDGTCPSIFYDVTFTVNTANIEVGANGMFLGGGVIGSANEHEMSDDDSDGTWEVTIPLLEGATGNYIFLNSPNDGGDWGAKENLAGQECADGQYNDRLLAPITGDTTLQHCFGSCETDGTCSAPAEPVVMPIDHENENVVYAWNDFGGAATTVIANPDASGINTSATVAQSIKTAGSETWAGTFLVLDEQLDLTTITTLAVDVWTPDGGELVNLKVENAADGNIAIEINQPTTVAAGWETLYYDLSGGDLSQVYDKLVFFFDFNVGGDDTPYYFDNIRLEEAPAVAGIDPGCNDFDSGTEGWTVVDAAGNESNWVLDETTQGGANESVYSMGHGYNPSTTAYNDWLVSPAYNTTGLSAPTLSYYEHLNWSTDAGEHNVLYSTDYDGDATTATWTLINAEIGTDAEDTWTQRVFALPSAENIVIAFQYVATFGADWNIDDVCVQEDTLSTVDATALDMRIYPNPSNGSYVTIQTPVNGVKYVEVFDITGKRLINTSLSADTLDVSSMSAGLYLVKVTVEGQSKTSKLIIR